MRSKTSTWANTTEATKLLNGNKTESSGTNIDTFPHRKDLKSLPEGNLGVNAFLSDVSI